MDLTITFPGGKQVAAQAGPYRILTDQPVEKGGQGEAPDPFTYFLASIGACAGIYVVGFCQARGLDPAGITLRQHVEIDPESKRVTAVNLVIEAPAGFPERYLPALAKAAEGCRVKRTLADPPEVTVVATLAAA